MAKVHTLPAQCVSLAFRVSGRELIPQFITLSFKVRQLSFKIYLSPGFEDQGEFRILRALLLFGNQVMCCCFCLLTVT